MAIYPFSLVCMNCESLFSSNRKPTAGSCGHTFCSLCVPVMDSCARCGKPAAFATFAVNYELLKLVEATKGNVFQYFDFWHGQFGKRLDLGSGICDSCSNPSSNLHVCKICCLENRTLRESNDNKDLHLVLPHGVTIHTISKTFERFCVDCILDDRTPHTGHKTVATSMISEYSIGVHQMCIIASSYNILKKSILETVGKKCRPVNYFFKQLERKLVVLRMAWHSEMISRFFGGDWNEEMAEVRRTREQSERLKEIRNLRRIMLEENIDLIKIPAAIEEYDVGKLKRRRVSI